MSTTKNNKLKQFSIVSLMLLVVIFSVLYTCSFAGSQNTKKKNITFGSEAKPQLNSSGSDAGFKNIFADVAEAVLPTVVSVVIIKVDTIEFSRNPFYQFFGNPNSGSSPFDFFFRPAGSRK